MITTEGKKVLYSKIKKGDLIQVKRLGIIPPPSSNRFKFLALILSGPHGNAGKYTFESKKGPGVILFDESDYSCQLYYEAIVEDRISKVYLKHFVLESLQKK
tara:strand:+ start:163 stop:468 length:306 start_codon:yes stop_codon:yes gene_type:complete